MVTHQETATILLSGIISSFDLNQNGRNCFVGAKHIAYSMSKVVNLVCIRTEKRWMPMKGNLQALAAK